MAINRYRYYLGPVGAVQALPRMPGGDNKPSAPLRVPGGVHQSLSGRQSLDRAGIPKRSWELEYDSLTEADRLLLDAAIQGAAGAPLRLVDPRSSNHLPADASAGGSLTRSTDGFTSSALVTDACGATVSNSWGTADTGQAWTSTGGAAGDYSKSGGLARHSMGSVNVTRRSVLATSLVDFDFTDSVATDKLATGAPQAASITGRDDGAGTAYYAQIHFTTANVLFLALIRNVAFVSTTLTSVTTAIAHVANTRYNRRFQMIGNVLRFKVWTGGVEPAAWNLTAVDTAIPGPGAVPGVESYLFTGNTNVLPVTFTYDNFQITGNLPLAYLAGTTPTPLAGVLGGCQNWSNLFLGGLLTASTEKLPVITGSTYRFSVWAKGTAQFKLVARPFDAAGVEQTLATGGTETPGAGFLRYSWLWTPSAGQVSAYLALQAQGAGNVQTSAWGVQIDQALLDWSFGVGCPEVFVDTDIDASYWRLKYHLMRLTLLEV